MTLERLIGKGKCPKCETETEVSTGMSELSKPNFFMGSCKRCGEFQTTEVWDIKEHKINEKSI